MSTIHLTEAEHLLDLLTEQGTPSLTARAAKLRRVMDAGDADGITDEVHAAKHELGLVCPCGEETSGVDAGFCSRRCWLRYDGGV